MLNKIKLFFLFLLFLCGCQTIGQKNCEINLDLEDSSKFVQEFAGQLASRFKLVNSVVFKYNFLSIAGIGYMDVDIENDSFNLSCMTPLGFKLFDVAAQKDNFESKVSLPEFSKKLDMGKLIARDIKRVYFDIVPDEKLRCYKTKKNTVFLKIVENGRYVYKFSNKNNLLSQKDFYEKEKLRWRVYYNSFEKVNEKNVPGEVVFKSYQFGYSFKLKVKQIQ